MSEIVRDITAIVRCGAQYRNDRLAEIGLRGCLDSFILEVCAFPGISQDCMARHICINKSNVARQAAVLEEEGFITRVPSPVDKRVLELYPTEKALKILPQLHEVMRCWEERITAELTEEEKTQLGPLLSKMLRQAMPYMEER